MARLPRFSSDYTPSGDDLNYILAIIDSGLGNSDPIISGISGDTLNPNFPNPRGSFNPSPGNIGALITPRGLTGAYGIDNFSQTHAAFVLLSWTPNPVTDFVAHYDIYYHKGSDPTLYVQSVSGNLTSTRINNLFPGITYSFAVKATDAADRSSAWCPEINITISLDSDPAATPTGLTATSTATGAYLTWTEVGPEGISNDLKQYQIAVSLDGGATYPTTVTVGPGNSCFYPQGGTVFFKIASVDWTGNVSAYSGAVSVSGTPATSALNANVVSAVVSGNNTRGQILITASAAGVGYPQKICTVTFSGASPHVAVPRTLVCNSSSGVQAATTNSSTFGVANVTTTAFDLWLTAGPNLNTSIPANATATVDYWCIE